MQQRVCKLNWFRWCDVAIPILTTALFTQKYTVWRHPCPFDVFLGSATTFRTGFRTKVCLMEDSVTETIANFTQPQTSTTLNTKTSLIMGKLGRAALTLRGHGNWRNVCYHQKISSTVLKIYVRFSRQYFCTTVKRIKELVKSSISIINDINYNYYVHLSWCWERSRDHNQLAMCKHKQHATENFVR